MTAPENVRALGEITKAELWRQLQESRREVERLSEALNELERWSWAIFHSDATLDHINIAKLHAHLRATTAPGFKASSKAATPRPAPEERR